MPTVRANPKKSCPRVKKFLFTLYHVLNVLPLEHCSLNTSHQSKSCIGNHFQNLKFLRVTILPRARAFYSACLRLRGLHDLVLGRTKVQHRLQQCKEQEEYRRFQQDVNMTASVHSPLVSNDQSSVEVVSLTATFGWQKNTLSKTLILYTVKTLTWNT